MSRPPTKTSLFYYVIVLIAAAVIAVVVFLRNFHAGEEAGSLAPPPAEGTTGAAKTVDERALAQNTKLAGPGKALFETNCASCHGPNGNGDGPRAASLSPKPRNYHSEKFKFGNDIVSIHNTIMKGSPGTSMPSFALLPLEDTWAIAHYVYTLIPNPPPITDQQLAQVPGGATGGAATPSASSAGTTPPQAGAPGTPPPAQNKNQTKTPAPADTVRIPIEVAMRQMTVNAVPVAGTQASAPSASAGAAIYGARCAGCHGDNGEGKRARVISVAPYRYEVTGDLTISTAPWTHDRNKFAQLVVQGLPGRIMPGQATLTSAQIDDLFSFVRSLVKTR
ncbi:MAG TPA: c-type cytochrome [bacterium]|jgi:mono/diheme cytochrome c family protein